MVLDLAKICPFFLLPWRYGNPNVKHHDRYTEMLDLMLCFYLVTSVWQPEAC